MMKGTTVLEPIAPQRDLERRQRVVQWSDRRREVVVDDGREVRAYRLHLAAVEPAGWYERLLEAPARPVERVSVGQLCDALEREREPVEAVGAITERVVGQLRREQRRQEAERLEGELRRAQALDTVAVAPFRERFLELAERDGLTLTVVAERLGWHSPGGRADTSRVARRLGLLPMQCSRRKRYVRNTRVQYETAALLCEALELDPHEVGV